MYMVSLINHTVIVSEFPTKLLSHLGAPLCTEISGAKVNCLPRIMPRIGTMLAISGIGHDGVPASNTVLNGVNSAFDVCHAGL